MHEEAPRPKVTFLSFLPKHIPQDDMRKKATEEFLAAATHPDMRGYDVSIKHVDFYELSELRQVIAQEVSNNSTSDFIDMLVDFSGEDTTPENRRNIRGIFNAVKEQPQIRLTALCTNKELIRQYAESGGALEVYLVPMP